MMKYRLYTPGPTSVPDATLLELAKPVTHHRTGAFRKTFDEATRLLQKVYRTKQPVYIVTGSGTSAFEAGLVSCVKAGSRVLNVANGKFGERWSKIARQYGMHVTDIEPGYGNVPSAAEVAAELKKNTYDAFIITQSETSTGTAADMAGIAKAVRDYSDTCLLIVDGITAIGALPFEMDAWGVDVAITGSQKSLMLPPGLAFVAVSERAQAAMKAQEKPANFYLDLRQYAKAASDSDTPFTPANTLVEALTVSLRMIDAEGIEAVWHRTHTVAEAFRQGMTALGLKLFSSSPADSVSAVYLPEGVSDADFRNALKNNHNIHIAGGQGSMKDQVFRVNHMGYTDAYDCLAVVAAVEHTLAKLGKRVTLGTGVAAAQKALAPLFA
ncbi:MAG: pyridoxal-phosphate-dependent aminotransferase family protein [Phycisphaerae bacterium]